MLSCWLDVFEQTLYMVFLLYGAGVINSPQRHGGLGVVQSLDLEHLHEQVGNGHCDGRPHHHPKHLLVELTLVFEIGGVVRSDKK